MKNTRQESQEAQGGQGDQGNHCTACSPFWAETPKILIDEALDFYPFTERSRLCSATALNSLTRFGLYLGIVLATLFMNPAYLLISVGIALVALATYFGMKQRGVLREGFEAAPTEAGERAMGTIGIVGPTLFTVPGAKPPPFIGGKAVEGTPIADVIGMTDRTLPTGPNPFMNVLVNEVLDNPKKGPAANMDTPDMARFASDQFQTRMYGDPTDVFQHTQNQRTWITQPSTSIPNDRGSFQDWLYRVPGKTCKEGNNAACRTATEGGAVTWLSSP